MGFQYKADAERSYSTTDEEGGRFTRTALKDLLALGRHAYDEGDMGFFIRRWLGDGSRIDRVGRQPQDLSAPWPPST